MEKKKDFWEYAKKKLLTDKLIVRVKEFKEDKIKAIPQAKIEKLKVFIHNPLFERERVSWDKRFVKVVANLSNFVHYLC